jgi:hypothetical protein
LGIIWFMWLFQFNWLSMWRQRNLVVLASCIHWSQQHILIAIRGLILLTNVTKFVLSKFNVILLAINHVKISYSNFTRQF